MAKPFVQYAKEISQGLNYGATWTPGTPLKLGHMGTFVNGVFRPQGNIQALGISFEVEVDPTATKYTYASQGGVSLSFKAQGQSSQLFQSLAEAEAGARISFTREN